MPNLLYISMPAPEPAMEITRILPFTQMVAVFILCATNGERKDSSSFQISKSQLDSFFLKAEQTGFFNLNARYDGGLADGAGILISMNNGGRKHSVHLINTDVPAINELINWFNTLLDVHQLRIYYGQKQQP